MMPVLWRVPGLGLEIPGYGLMLMIGFLVSIMWAARRAERSGANPDVVLNAGFIALLGGVIGARAMYVWHYWEQFAIRGSLSRIIIGVIDVRKGGLEVYGGVILVVISVLFYLWVRKHSIRWYLDIMAPSCALGMAIGRIGCFLNGCCWGGVCDLPWAVSFPYGSGPAQQQWTDRTPGAALPQELLVFPPRGVLNTGAAAYPIPRESIRATDQQLARARENANQAATQSAELRARATKTSDPRLKQQLLARVQAVEAAAADYFDIRWAMQRHGMTAAEIRALAARHRSLPVHPTQPYSIITLGLLAALLSAVYWRRTRDGQVILTLFLIEPWTRWALEMLRADNPVDTVGFTVSQFLAICLSAVGLIGLLLLRYLPPHSPRAVLWEPPEEAPAKKKKPKATAT